MISISMCIGKHDLQTMQNNEPHSLKTQVHTMCVSAACLLHYPKGKNQATIAPVPLPGGMSLSKEPIK